MPPETLGQRLEATMKARGLQPAEVARRAKTTEATIHNWLKDKVRTDHVKAFQLFNIADALEADPRSLLFGQWAAAGHIREHPEEPYVSQVLKQEALTLAFQLATEAEEALQKQGRTLPSSKRAELTQLAYDLLDEDLPRAKVLRFVLAAAA
ncbi:MAG TPA: helix-turn-helix transcriptional regulator [Pedomonas sp.]|nr:helix-turn-helix transcriptional regulator [Pedomonas sp.]